MVQPQKDKQVRVGVRELRANLSGLLRQARQGTSFLVMSRNEVIAEIRPPAVADTTAPTAALTAPADGATVSGTTVTVSAAASDNVGVAGVQFKLDGVSLGAEDTSSPYAIAWNTTTAVNGSHTLTAVARDGAGNTVTSAAVTAPSAAEMPRTRTRLPEGRSGAAPRNRNGTRRPPVSRKCRRRLPLSESS